MIFWQDDQGSFDEDVLCDLRDVADYYDESEEEDKDSPDVAPSDADWTEVTDTTPKTNNSVKGFKPDVEFKVENPGPRGFAPNMTESEIFTIMMGGEQFWIRGTEMTNLYAAQHKRVRWKDLTVREFNCFIGALLYMGAKRINRAQAFKSVTHTNTHDSLSLKSIAYSIYDRPYPFGDDLLKKIYGKGRRFTDIFACMHWVNNDDVGAAARRDDVFWQVRSLINGMNEAAKEHYVPEQGLGLDEKVTAFKGRCRAKQFNPQKPGAKWHIKDFVLAESSTGFVCGFFPYQGKDPERDAKLPVSEFAIKQLVTKEYWDKGYLLAWDNWFASFAAADFAKKKGVWLVYTLRRGRKGYVSSSRMELPKGAARGTMKIFKHKSEDHYLAVWLDNKVVRIGSTFPIEIGTCKRRSKQGGKIKGDVWAPTSVGLYNFIMGAVDRGDQSNSYVRIRIQSNRNMRNYQLGLFVCGANQSRIICNKLRNEKKGIIDFTEVLCQQLMNPYLTQIRAGLSSSYRLFHFCYHFVHHFLVTNLTF